MIEHVEVILQVQSVIAIKLMRKTNFIVISPVRGTEELMSSPVRPRRRRRRPMLTFAFSFIVDKLLGPG